MYKLFDMLYQYMCVCRQEKPSVYFTGTKKFLYNCSSVWHQSYFGHNLTNKWIQVDISFPPVMTHSELVECVKSMYISNDVC